MSYYCSTHDLTVPDEVADAARRVIRWAAENDLTAYQVYGLGPVFELHGDLNIAKLRLSAAQKLILTYSTRLQALAEDLDLLRRIRAAQGAVIMKLHEENLRLKQPPMWVKIVAWFAR